MLSALMMVYVDVHSALAYQSSISKPWLYVRAKYDIGKNVTGVHTKE